MKITHILTFITIIFLVTACEHKELCFAHAHTTEMQVIFNWKYAPEAQPRPLLRESGGPAMPLIHRHAARQTRHEGLYLIDCLQLNPDTPNRNSEPYRCP